MRAWLTHLCPCTLIIWLSSHFQSSSFIHGTTETGCWCLIKGIIGILQSLDFIHNHFGCLLHMHERWYHTEICHRLAYGYAAVGNVEINGFVSKNCAGSMKFVAPVYTYSTNIMYVERNANHCLRHVTQLPMVDGYRQKWIFFCTPGDDYVSANVIWDVLLQSCPGPGALWETRRTEDTVDLRGRGRDDVTTSAG